MIRKYLVVLLTLSPLTAFSQSSNEGINLNILNSGVEGNNLEDFIIVPFQGTWVSGANTFIFTAGDTRLDGNWVAGNIIGGGGQTNRYLWFQNTALTGQFYFDTAQGRQGPIFVTLSNLNRRMTWRFGSETTVLDKVN